MYFVEYGTYKVCVGKVDFDKLVSMMVESGLKGIAGLSYEVYRAKRLTAISPYFCISNICVNTPSS